MASLDSFTSAHLSKRGAACSLLAASLGLPPACQRPGPRPTPAAVAPDAGGGGIVDGTWGGLRVRVAGERTRPRQVLVLLHGWGAPGDDLVPLAGELAAPGRLFVFPEAPLVSIGGGRAWWHLDLALLEAARERGQERDLRREVPDGLAQAHTALVRLLDEIARRTQLPPSAIVLGGFSQGAMLATDVVLASPARVGALVVLSGTLVAEDSWRARLSAATSKPRVFMSHGRWDGILPFHLAEALRDALQGASWPVTWVPFDGAHAIPPVVMSGLERFLDAGS